MRICLVTPFAWSQPHDVNDHVAGVAAALRRHGHEATVLAPSTRAADLLAGRRALTRGDRPEVIAVGPAVRISARSQLGVPVGVQANLRQALAQGGYDVVHGFEPGLPSLSYLALRDADALVRAELDDDRAVLLGGRCEERRVDARRHRAVVAGKALARRGAHAVGERDQRVDPAEQLLACRSRRRVAEAVRGDEGRDRERIGVAQGEVGQRGESRLEAVDDVEPEGQGLAEVRLYSDRYAELGATRHGDRGSHCDHLGTLPRRECAPARQQVARACRGGDDGDLVAERTKLAGDPANVVVDVVRLRPRERGHQANSHIRSVVHAKRAAFTARFARSRREPERRACCAR